MRAINRDQFIRRREVAVIGDERTRLGGVDGFRSLEYSIRLQQHVISDTAEAYDQVHHFAGHDFGRENLEPLETA